METTTVNPECAVYTNGATPENEGTSVVCVDFSNLPLKKIAALSAIGGRMEEENADWMLVVSRMIFAMRKIVGPSVCPLVRQGRRNNFVLELEVETSSVDVATNRIAVSLYDYGVRVGVFR